jgi:hypothetical protein
VCNNKYSYLPGSSCRPLSWILTTETWCQKVNRNSNLRTEQYIPCSVPHSSHTHILPRESCPHRPLPTRARPTHHSPHTANPTSTSMLPGPKQLMTPPISDSFHNVVRKVLRITLSDPLRSSSRRLLVSLSAFSLSLSPLPRSSLKTLAKSPGEPVAVVA